jgi:hypothetical protein
LASLLSLDSLALTSSPSPTCLFSLPSAFGNKLSVLLTSPFLVFGSLLYTQEECSFTVVLVIRVPDWDQGPLYQIVYLGLTLSLPSITWKMRLSFKVKGSVATRGSVPIGLSHARGLGIGNDVKILMSFLKVFVTGHRTLFNTFCHFSDRSFLDCSFQPVGQS